MKKIVFLILVLSLFFNVCAIETNGRFTIVKQKNPKDYQQYVGHVFQFRPAIGLLETWNNAGVYVDSDMYEHKYTISKITVKNVKHEGEPNRRIEIEAVQFGGNNKVSFKAYEEYSVGIGFFYNLKHYPTIGYLPIVFCEPLEDFKRKHVGEMIEHELVKDTYKIIDAFVGVPEGKENEVLAEAMVSVENVRTGDYFVYPYSSVNKDAFKKALDGFHTLHLDRVERSDADENGELKIKKDSVTRYSYRDSLIEVGLYLQGSRFNLLLKNKTDHTMRVHWNEGSYVGLDGLNSKIVHAGVKYKDVDKSVPATVVMRGSAIDDIVIPVNKIHFDKNEIEWAEDDLLTNDFISKNPGEVYLMLPIQIRNTIYEYIFAFKVHREYYYKELLKTDKL